ncbi:hypothetical protein [Quadrisphaera setariae]|uniref:PH domain-containing protein n=1 Tax=Quadrisphaera setariae TaxID=2593304 RepID=A0A5C8Z5N6_9ACTN|nr:hypothetical protein [Quadrisphaera setariae]TXR52664.1 hypothetical protein FMM08_18070 [Quadrisphaera setariae]
MSGAPDGWSRYARWEGTYRVLDRTVESSPRARRVLRALVVVWLVVAVRWVVHLVSSDGWGGLAGPVAWALIYLAWDVFSGHRPVGTSLGPAGLSVRAHPFRLRTVAWEDVVAVEPAGRFEDAPAALLSGGARLSLVGVPADVTEAMAAVTRPKTEPEPVRRTSPAARRPEPGEDLDGPFHRGPARR